MFSQGFLASKIITWCFLSFLACKQDSIFYQLFLACKIESIICIFSAFLVGKKHVDDFSHTPKRLRKHGVLCFGDQKLKSNQIIILQTKRSWKNKSIQEEFQSVLKRVCFQNGGGLAGGHGSIVQITHTLEVLSSPSFVSRFILWAF